MPGRNWAFLSTSTRVRAQLHNYQGQLVRTVVDGVLSSGEHRIAWDGRDNNRNTVANGVYFCRLQSRDFSSTRKTVLLR